MKISQFTCNECKVFFLHCELLFKFIFSVPFIMSNSLLGEVHFSQCSYLSSPFSTKGNDNFCTLNAFTWKLKLKQIPHTHTHKSWLSRLKEDMKTVCENWIVFKFPCHFSTSWANLIKKPAKGVLKIVRIRINR